MVIAGSEMLRRGLTGRSFLYQAFGVRTVSTGQGAATTSVPYELGERAHATITIERPRQEVFAFWRDVTNLPRFMKHLKSVEVRDSKRSHWVAQGPAGMRLEWNAEVIHEVPHELIGWRSTKGSELDSAGSVQFQDTSSGGTRVAVDFQYNPPAGSAGAFVAKLFGRDPQAEMQVDLIRLKSPGNRFEVASGGFCPATQHLGYAPGLRYAAARRKRRRGVEDLADGAQARLSKVRRKTLQKSACFEPALRINLQPGIDERADQPGPHRALMIRGISGQEIALVSGFILRVVRG